MIINTAHTVSPYLSNSQTVFREQLEKSTAESQAQIPPKDGATIRPVPSKDAVTIQPVPSEEVVPSKPSLDKGQLSDEYLAKQQLEENIQARRDHARQAAVYAAELKQTQTNIDTYVNASTDSDDTGDTTNASDINPANVYEKSLDYQQRDDLLAAFEQATTPEGLGMKINIML